VYNGEMAMTLHRVGDSNTFAWSVSNRDFGRNPSNKETIEKFRTAVQRKNPQYKYIMQYWREVKNIMYTDDKNNLYEKFNYGEEALNIAQKVADTLQKDSRPSSSKYILANVRMDKAEMAFKNAMESFYIGPQDKGIGNRRTNVRELINSGELKYAPMASIHMGNNGSPYLSFDDGRHRFSELRDMGVKTINMAFSPESKKYIDLLR
jgi:disulfide oxidoreductase YuzD